MRKRKRKTGVLLRLIDIVFNLLFAFIALAQVNAKRVDLAQSAQAEEAECLSFTVTIDEEGYVVAQNALFSYPLPRPGAELAGGADSVLAEWLSEKYLAHMKHYPIGKQVEPVQIRAERGAPMQWIFEVSAACRAAGANAAVVVQPRGGR